MHRLSSIVESRYARNYIPKFQAEFHVPEEEPDAPFQSPLIPGMQELAVLQFDEGARTPIDKQIVLGD